MRVAICCFTLLAASISIARAQQPLPTTLLGGEARQSLAANCYINRGFATFQRNFNLVPKAGTKAVVSFSEFVLGSGTINTSWDLSGQAIMTFTSATAGTIRFKDLPTAPSNVANGTFAYYVEAYDSARAQFAIVFRVNVGSCSLPVQIHLDPSKP